MGRAFHPWLGAEIPLPLVPAGQGVTGSTVLPLPADGVDLVAGLEETAKEGDLGRRRRPRGYRGGHRCGDGSGCRTVRGFHG